jgi:hypothetical protein
MLTLRSQAMARGTPPANVTRSGGDDQLPVTVSQPAHRSDFITLSIASAVAVQISRGFHAPGPAGHSAGQRHPDPPTMRPRHRPPQGGDDKPDEENHVGFAATGRITIKLTLNSGTVVHQDHRAEQRADVAHARAGWPPSAQHEQQDRRGWQTPA